MKTLEALLGLRPEQLHSLVVFVGESTFKTEIQTNVTQGIGYIRYIKSKRDVVLSTDEVKEVIDKIGKGRLQPSIRTQINHLTHVKEQVKKKVRDNSCPKCGSEMVLRVVKKGEYAGKQSGAVCDFHHVEERVMPPSGQERIFDLYAIYDRLSPQRRHLPCLYQMTLLGILEQSSNRGPDLLILIMRQGFV